MRASQKHIPWSAGLLAIAVLGSSPRASFAQDFAKEWQPLAVPGFWQTTAGDKLAKHSGFAWYRCWVKVPADWKGSDLSLFVEAVHNAHECFVNGVRVGGVGSLPPGFREATNTANNYTIAENHVRPGAYNYLAIRVFCQAAKGGFGGTAPAIINETRAISLAGTWQFRTGDDLAWAQPPAKPGDGATFLKVQDTTALPRPALASAKGLSAADATRGFQTAKGLRVDLAVAEPQVRNPVCINFDEKGRMWVANYLQYPNPAGLKRLSRDIFWRVIYDKVPPAPPHHFRGKDRITVHEDTDGDEGLSIATSALPGRGGVWVLNPPYLLFYPATGPDALTPGDPVVHLEGFGIEDTHSAASNLHWGPDGWIYGAHGSTVTAQVRRPGDKKAIAQMIGQHIWRYHPEKKRFEVFGEGGGNAWGVEIDSLGRVFSGHNGGNTRGFHYVQGGLYRKGFEKHGALSNPYAFGFFEAMKHPNVQRFSHTFVIYEANALPSEYHGKLFAVTPLQGQVVYSDVFRDGSSLQTKDLGLAAATKDPWFRPVNIALGPDGGLYVADMNDAHIAHLRHFEGQIDYDTGRVYRIIGKDAKPVRPFDLAKKSSAELIELLGHENRWFREMALRVLGFRRDPKALAPLHKLLTESKGQLALQALWALNLSGGFSDDIAALGLAHAEPAVRAWTVRLLGDENQVPKTLAQPLADVARQEKDVQVRVQLACSARRLPAAQGLPIVRQLLSHDEDASDIHQPLLIWWAIEAKCGPEPAAVVELFRDSTVWNTKLAEQTVLTRLMRRFALAGTQKDMRVCMELFRAAPEKKHGAILLKGFEEAFKGRSIAGLPTELLEEIAKLGGGSIAFGIRLGRPEALSKALALVHDGKISTSQREEIVSVLGEAKQPSCIPVLLEIVAGKQPDSLRRTALAALQSYNDDRIGAAVVKVYPQLPADVRDTAETLLVSRKSWSKQWLSAVDAGSLPAKDFSTAVLKKILLHRDAEIAALVKKHWGEVKGATTAQMRQEVDRLVDVVRSGIGNPYTGKQLFNKRCAACHTLHSQGGTVGPDLTPFKRDDIANMLLHIVNPSAEIREGYENQIIVTESGRTLTGIVTEKDTKVLVLRTADGQKVVLPKDDIAETHAAGISLMPEGLLQGLSDADVRNLLAYLRSTQPLNDR
jgi:putative heme-binding domain-containing protein